jgi:hypothetical protein
MSRRTYQVFKKSIFLIKLMRQKETSSSIVQFQNIVLEMRDDFVFADNWQFLLTRSRERLSFQEWATFVNFLRLYARNNDSKLYNIKTLKRLNDMKIIARHHEKEVKNAFEKNANRLCKELLIFKDCRVMFTCIMWTKKELINDAMSIVLDFLWNDDINDSFKHMFAILLMIFDTYHDFANIKIRKINAISVVSKINQWNNNDIICSRSQFSLISVFAISIHKSQELTLSRTMLSFRRTNNCYKQNYVALSRVRCIEHVTFDSIFSYDHFSKRMSKNVIRRLQDNDKKQERQIKDFLLKFELEKLLELENVMNEHDIENVLMSSAIIVVIAKENVVLDSIMKTCKTLIMTKVIICFSSIKFMIWLMYSSISSVSFTEDSKKTMKSLIF